METKLLDMDIIEPKPKQTCLRCKYNEAHQCGSKVFHYCGITKSNRTSNGQKKIKCKDIACNLFHLTVKL